MLHGKIEVNDVAVGYWEAKRVRTVMNGVHKYECKLFYRNHQGYPLHAEFSVVHAEASGAARLASVVLSNGSSKLKGYPPGQPTQFPI